MSTNRTFARRHPDHHTREILCAAAIRLIAQMPLAAASAQSLLGALKDLTSAIRARAVEPCPLRQVRRVLHQLRMRGEEIGKALDHDETPGCPSRLPCCEQPDRRCTGLLLLSSATHAPVSASFTAEKRGQYSCHSGRRTLGSTLQPSGHSSSRHRYTKLDDRTETTPRYCQTTAFPSCALDDTKPRNADHLPINRDLLS